MKISPPITWFGGKSKLANHIVSHFPEQHTNVEPIGGIDRHRRHGAYLTQYSRNSNTEMGIWLAIADLRANGQRVTVSAFGRVLEMSREHRSRRYRHLFSKA